MATSPISRRNANTVTLTRQDLDPLAEHRHQGGVAPLAARGVGMASRGVGDMGLGGEPARRCSSQVPDLGPRVDPFPAGPAPGEPETRGGAPGARRPREAAKNGLGRAHRHQPDDPVSSSSPIASRSRGRAPPSQVDQRPSWAATRPGGPPRPGHHPVAGGEVNAKPGRSGSRQRDHGRPKRPEHQGKQRGAATNTVISGRPTRWGRSHRRRWRGALDRASGPRRMPNPPGTARTFSHHTRTRSPRWQREEEDEGQQGQGPGAVLGRLVVVDEVEDAPGGGSLRSMRAIHLPRRHLVHGPPAYYGTEMYPAHGLRERIRGVLDGRRSSRGVLPTPGWPPG